jgi:hypothetical protein
MPRGLLWRPLVSTIGLIDGRLLVFKSLSRLRENVRQGCQCLLRILYSTESFDTRNESFGRQGLLFHSLQETTHMFAAIPGGALSTGAVSIAESMDKSIIAVFSAVQNCRNHHESARFPLTATIFFAAKRGERLGDDRRLYHVWEGIMQHSNQFRGERAAGGDAHL